VAELGYSADRGSRAGAGVIRRVGAEGGAWLCATMGAVACVIDAASDIGVCGLLAEVGGEGRVWAVESVG